MFSILSLNIQSSNAQFDQLHIFVQQLRQSNHEFSVICLRSQHGGLVIYLNIKYNYKNITLGKEFQIWKNSF